MGLKERNTALIKNIAKDLGFQYCGIAKAEYLAEEAPRLEKWLKTQQHGQMQYMENHYDKRLDPTKLVPGAKSVVSLIFNYYPEKDLGSETGFKIAKYAYGKDYHFVIKEKLKDFHSLIHEKIGEVGGRVFVDSAPVMERVWAKKAGLGWIGKNTLLLNKGMGSFFFIAELILDIELIEDGPVKDYCGSCTACIDACPTDAITAPQWLDASKCISYMTIELKDEIPGGYENKFDNWIFGCDICQDVCPWNRFSSSHKEPAFDPHPDLMAMKENEWLEMTKDVFNVIFKKSAVKRTKYEGLKRNMLYIEKARQKTSSI